MIGAVGFLTIGSASSRLILKKYPAYRGEFLDMHLYSGGFWNPPLKYHKEITNQPLNLSLKKAPLKKNRGEFKPAAKYEGGMKIHL